MAILLYNCIHTVLVWYDGELRNNAVFAPLSFIQCFIRGRWGISTINIKQTLGNVMHKEDICLCFNRA